MPTSNTSKTHSNKLQTRWPNCISSPATLTTWPTNKARPMLTRRFSHGSCSRTLKVKTATSSLKMCQSKNLSNTWAKKFTPPTRHKMTESSNSHKSCRDKDKESGLRRPCPKFHSWSKSRLSRGLLLPFSTSKWARARKEADCKIEKTLPWKRAADQAQAKSACQRKKPKATRLNLNRGRLWVLPSADWQRVNAWSEFWALPFRLIEYYCTSGHTQVIN